MRVAVNDVITQYENFTSTSPTAYEEATEAINQAIEPLITRKQNLDDYYDLIARVDEVIAQYADIASVNTTSAYTRLVKARDYYSGDSKIKNDTVILNSIKQLTSYLDKLLSLTSGIDEITAVKEANSKYYNLQGQQINSLHKGIHIINGKKVLVR
jgi:hypothetical protein